MPASTQEVSLAVDSYLARTVPDRRTRACDVSVRRGESGLVVTGVVSSHPLASGLFDVLARYPSVDRADSFVQVLADLATRTTVTRTAVPVRAGPDADAEQVTQVLYGDAVEAYDVDGEWRRVRAPDGYLGWLRASSLVPPTSLDPDAVLAEPVDPSDVPAPNAEDEPLAERLPIGTQCRTVETGAEDVVVRFRTGLELTLPAEVVTETDDRVTGERVCETATRFLGTDYEWGGMTTAGIDCSGLVWVAYRQSGVSLPRDADQQRLVGDAVSRDELRAGDLLFFPGHVAISLGGSRYVHAHGDSGGVVVNSVDPAADDYLDEHDEGLACCRRLLTETG